jgi:hypothetical protein
MIAAAHHGSIQFLIHPIPNTRCAMSNEVLIDVLYIGGGPKLAFIVDRQCS